MNNVEEANAVFQEALRRGFDSYQLRSWAYLVALLQHNHAAMQEHLTAAMNKPGGKGWALLQLGDVANLQWPLASGTQVVLRSPKRGAMAARKSAR